MTPFGNRLQSLSPRERAVFLFGVVAAVLIVLYSFVWQPWQEELDRLRTQVPIKRENLAWMQQQARTIGPLAKKAGEKKNADDKPLLTIVEQSAKSSKMDAYIRRMAPGEGEQVKIWLTEADFDRWVVWLEALRTSGIEVESATINRAKDNKVTIRMTLQR